MEKMEASADNLLKIVKGKETFCDFIDDLDIMNQDKFLTKTAFRFWTENSHSPEEIKTMAKLIPSFDAFNMKEINSDTLRKDCYDIFHPIYKNFIKKIGKIDCANI